MFLRICSLNALATRITKNSTLHCQRKAIVRLLPKTDPQKQVGKVWDLKTFNSKQAGIQMQKKLLGTHERLGRAEKNDLMACAQTILPTD